VSAARTMISAIPRLSVLVPGGFLSVFALVGGGSFFVLTLVGAFFELAGVGSLLDEIEKALGELLVCQWVCGSWRGVLVCGVVVGGLWAVYLGRWT
jgi:hypothetical protein